MMEGCSKRACDTDQQPTAQAPKRMRSDPACAVFLDVIEAGGCSSYAKPPSTTFSVTDQRRLHKHVETQLLSDSELCATFATGLEDYLQDSQILEAALLPMHAEVTSCAGDSFLRVMLSIGPIQAQVSRCLLELLPTLEEDGGDRLPRLILGQFRWLDHIVDPHAMTEKILEVATVCSQDTQKEIVSLLPEIVQEDAHELVLNSLEEMVEQDSASIVPVLETLSNLSMRADLQERTVHMILGCLQSVDVADLATMAQFLLQASTSDTAKEVVQEVRKALHFVNCSDPRLSVRDNKQKGKTGLEADAPELSVLKAMRTGLQCSHAASDAFMRMIRAMTDPDEHKTVDLWVLLLFHASGGQKAKATEGALRKKLGSGGPAWIAWLHKATKGHQAVVQYMFSTLLAVAQMLTSAALSAGCELYKVLFESMEDSFYRQEVLRCLHAHVGSLSAPEVSTALDVFLGLSTSCPAHLGQYAAFVTSMMDHLDTFAPAQLHQVFTVLSELVVNACGSQAALGTRTRLEDELHILLQKQLTSADPTYQRSGIIGTVALVQRMAHQPTLDAIGDASLTERRCREAEQLLQSSFRTKDNAPSSFALLCDELAIAVSEGQLAKPTLKWLHNIIAPIVEDGCGVLKAGELDSASATTQVPGGGTMEGQALLGLDGSADIVFPALPRLASTNKFERGWLEYACSSLHLLQAVVQQRHSGSLRDIDALLGCPLHLLQPPMLAMPAFLALAPARQDLVCHLLFYAISWLRELISAFAPTLDVSRQFMPVPVDEEEVGVEDKLVSRLLHLCQLEALLAECLAACRTPITFPCLGALAQAPVRTASRLTQAKRKAGKSKATKGKPGMQTADEDTHKENSHETALSMPEADPSVADPAVADGGCDGAAVKEIRLDGIRALLRPLHLGSLKLLKLMRQLARPAAARPAAAYLLADLRPRLHKALAKKRPLFMQASGLDPQPAGCSSPVELLAGLAEVLPDLRAQLDEATGLLRDTGLQDPDDAGCSSGEQAEPHACHVLTQPPTAQAALACVPAAIRLLTQGLECVRLVACYDGLRSSERRSSLTTFLAAFGADCSGVPVAAGNQGGRQLAQACETVSTYFQGLSLGSCGQFEVEMALVRMMAALLALARALLPAADVLDSPLLARMQSRLSRVAGEMLEQAWDHCPAVAGGDVGGADAGWKGRAAPMADLLHLLVAGHADPLQQVLRLVQQVLSLVPSQTSGKKAHAPAEPYAALSGSSLVVWYRVLFEEVVGAWEAAAKRARWTGGRAAGQEEGEALLQQTSSCAAAFACLLQFTKNHPRRTQVHVQAVKNGGKCIDVFLKTFPFWQAWLGQHREAVDDFLICAKEVQRGTRILQNICNDAKARKDLGLTAKVPAVKRSLEKFLFVFKALCTAVDKGQAFSLGKLKHRDITGQEIMSQGQDSSDEDADAEDDDDDDDVVDNPFDLEDEDV
ncbi:hypothetical protein WJX72_008290 [[Myrmecia] bisecta]|uniref:Fanconi anemia group D2 protein n=1 Tax=[Myrmecia] bisecta TaxID=41462 RepID=A0AAW1PQW4_9CHLO